MHVCMCVKREYYTTKMINVNLVRKIYDNEFITMGV